MVKTKVKKKEPSEVQNKDVTKSKTEESFSESSNSSLMMPLMFLLLVIIVILQIVILLTPNSSSSSSVEDLNEINEKVTRIDNFFNQNIEGYGTSGSAPNQELNPENFPTVQKPTIENRPMLGNLDAPITIVEFSDFECPFCARFYQTTYPTLKRFVEDGTVNLVFKDFPLSFHRLAEPAGVASKCVFRELGNDAFFTYHDTVFENQQSLSEANLRQWALDLGIDSSVYDECIQDSEIKAQVQADFIEGQQIGVSGTPSVVINDKLVVGACPAQTFEQAIALELEGTPFFVEECQVITA